MTIATCEWTVGNNLSMAKKTQRGIRGEGNSNETGAGAHQLMLGAENPAFFTFVLRKKLFHEVIVL